MARKSTLLPRLFLGAAMPLAVALSGCSFVKRQDMNDQLAAMRSEMEAERRAEIAEGDRQTSEALNGRMDGLAARMDGLERELAALEEDFDARVEELETALRFDVPVYFGFDEAEISPQYMAFLDRFSQVVTQYYPSSLITVEGFTDPVGTPEYNLALGKRRAEAVRAYLVEQRGLSADMVRAVSYGEAADRLVSAAGRGPGQEGWENRRVALVIDHSGS
jgi:outer membrane protein OmpA-like peptidoglycan-associated protein